MVRHTKNCYRVLVTRKMVSESLSHEKWFQRSFHAKRFQTEKCFRGIITGKVVFEGFSLAKWFQRSYHEENGFRRLVTHKMGLIECLEGDHRSFSNIRTKISRHIHNLFWHSCLGDSSKTYYTVNPSKVQKIYHKGNLFWRSWLGDFK